MLSFEDFKLTTPLSNALEDLGFTEPTPIQEAAFNVLCAGKDVVGIAQTGTGKTLAYSLPIIRNLEYSTQESPRVLIMVPTRELVVQVVDSLKALNVYTNNRVLGVYGGTNINTQKQQISEGIDILVATPGRLYDLALSRVLQLKNIQKLVIDEVDVMLDLVRNDLSKIAKKGTVKVTELCEIHSFKQVHHMISTVEAEVLPTVSAVGVIAAAFPMGSMTGAPKISAMTIIEELEETKRGVYSGAVGYFSPQGDFDFNVVIRSILYNASNSYVSFSVGSAITSKSTPEKEYEECLVKAKAMRSVLEN